jgi:hypothetical protein
MGTKRNAYSLLMEKRPLDRPRHGWVILRLILERWDEGVLNGLFWLRIGISGELS